MAKLKGKNEIISHGPWLLTKQNLKELDNIFQKIDSLLEDAYQDQINQEIEKESLDTSNEYKSTSKDEIKTRLLNRYSFRSEKKASIITVDNQTLEGTNLLELLKANDLTNIKPSYLKLQIRKGASEVLSNFSSSTYSGGIEFNLNVEKDSISEDIKYLIHDWIDNNKPKKVIRIWSHFHLLGAFLLFFSCCFLYSNYAVVKTPYNLYKSDLIKEANIILDSGFKKGEENKALELLLKFQVGYVPKKYYKSEINNDILLKFCITYIIVIILLSIKTPKPFIGLGRNEKEANFRKGWYKFVSYSIPSTVFSALLYDLWKAFFQR